MRRGLGAHSAVLHESTSAALDAFRAPLATIGAAEIVVVVGDDAVVDRAPVVELWLKQARRNGAEIVTIGAAGSTPTPPGSAADALQELVGARSAVGKRLRDSERAVLVWSGPGGGGGARLAEAAHALGFEGKPGCAAFHLPATPNARGVAEAWAAAADEDEVEREGIGLLDRLGRRGGLRPGRPGAGREGRPGARDHDVPVARDRLGRPRAARRPRRSSARGPSMNLEGRVQRLRRAVTPPVPDELAWLAKLASRFDAALSPHAAVVFEELSGRIYDGLELSTLGERAPLPAPAPYVAPAPAPASVRGQSACGGRRRDRPLRRHAPAPALPAALLRPSRRARARAPVPAPRA